VTMANGLDGTRFARPWKAIDKVRGQVSGIEVLRGVECDILEDATLDLPDDVLAEADWVIAVLHYGLKQPREQIMKRLLTAVRSPHVDALGHLTGRIVGKRAGSRPRSRNDAQRGGRSRDNDRKLMPIPVDSTSTTSAPPRARALKIPIVIDTDAHSVTGLDVMRFGVFQARRAGHGGERRGKTPFRWRKFRKLLKNG